MPTNNRKQSAVEKLAQTGANRYSDKIDSILAGGRSDQPLAGARRVNIDLVRSSPFQARSEFPHEAMQELTESVRANGILEPLLVRRVTDKETARDVYELIAGERRLRAAKDAGLTDVPVIIKDATEQEVKLLMLIENLQRADLLPLDEKRFFQQLQKEYNFSQSDIAKLIHKSNWYVSTRLSIPVPVIASPPALPQPVLVPAQAQPEPIKSVVGEIVHNVLPNERLFNPAQYEQVPKPIEGRYTPVPVAHKPRAEPVGKQLRLPEFDRFIGVVSAAIEEIRDKDRTQIFANSEQETAAVNAAAALVEKALEYQKLVLEKLGR